MSRCVMHVGDVFAEMAKLPDDSVDCRSPRHRSSPSAPTSQRIMN